MDSIKLTAINNTFKPTLMKQKIDEIGNKYIVHPLVALGIPGELGTSRTVMMPLIGAISGEIVRITYKPDEESHNEYLMRVLEAYSDLVRGHALSNITI